MVKTQDLGHIKKLGRLYLAEPAPFDEQLIALHGQDIEFPISVRDASYARLNSSPTYGTRTCLAPILAKNSPVIVARISPLVTNIKMARKAAKAHELSQYPIFEKEVYERWNDTAEKDKSIKPEKRRAFFLEQRVDHKIHKDSEQARALWQDALKNYFEKYVSGDSVQSYQVDPRVVDSQEGTIVNYLWFNGVDNGSYLVFRSRFLDDGNRTLGVLRKTGEASLRAEKIVSKQVLPYTPKQIDKELERLLKLESEIKKSRQFLERLKQ